MRITGITAAVLLLLLMLCCAASAEEAKDISAGCTYTCRGKTFSSARMLDRSYQTHSNLARGATLGVKADRAVSGVYIQLYKDTAEGTLQACVKGKWQDAGTFGSYLAQWLPVPEGTTELRIVNGRRTPMYIAELTVYGEGERPAGVQTWQTQEKADLMLVTAHPDDELLWFGGFLPTYAAELGYKVQVVCLTLPDPDRQLELLDALWLCGVRWYPCSLGLPDKYSRSLKAQYGLWSRTVVYRKLTSAIRRYKPEVILTQDADGEYGHGAHRVCADAVKNAVSYAADAGRWPDSVKAYGLWQAKKVYIHLYPENQIHLNWNRKLTAFGGRTAIEVATEALECHASQTARGWNMNRAALYDNALFGLYYTAVGPDTAKNDFMEHIPGAVILPAGDDEVPLR